MTERNGLASRRGTIRSVWSAAGARGSEIGSARWLTPMRQDGLTPRGRRVPRGRDTRGVRGCARRLSLLEDDELELFEGPIPSKDGLVSVRGASPPE